MKTLYFDCGMGAAGDMLSAALLELFDDKQAVLDELNALGIPGVEFKAEVSTKCGINGTHLSVTVNGEEEESADVHDHEHHAHDHVHEHEYHHDHDHEHTHEHEHGHGHHHHSSMADIEHIIGHLPLENAVRADVIAVYKLIAEAESHAHGMPVSEIHFHEVGTMDAVADITATCLLIRKLAPEKIVASPVHVGAGKVRCAHGVLPVPAPATAYILRDVPIYGGRIQGELCTPTGAALLKHFAAAFGDMPVMRVQRVGYGMGKKDFEVANCVRDAGRNRRRRGLRLRAELQHRRYDRRDDWLCGGEDSRGGRGGGLHDRRYDEEKPPWHAADGAVPRGAEGGRCAGDFQTHGDHRHPRDAVPPLCADPHGGDGGDRPRPGAPQGVFRLRRAAREV